MSRRLVVLSGPSGVGKGTVVDAMREIRPDLWCSVSATTRAQRSGEIHGVHYSFMSEASFDQMVAEGGFLEWAAFAGNKYGTPAAPVLARLDSDQSVLMEIELQGARQVHSRMPEALMVFLKPPSFEALEARLRGRGTEDDAAIQTRLERARTEMDAASEFEHVVLNDDVNRAARELLELL